MTLRLAHRRLLLSIFHLCLLAAGILAVVLASQPAAAQSLTLDLGEGGSSTGRIVQLMVLITVLSLAPAVLVMVTSF
ncbi:MAG: flagellar biosynthetic protein FliP, partial [Alphaproteobacteria bacterium]|nr:flagellar biosynthetic protein FliP [Alphaproteobacteria bacterium]